MASRTLAGLGLKGFWALGEDGWKDENDLNLLSLSVLVQGRALSKEDTTPGAPADGDVYIFSDVHPTQANKIAVYDVATWKYITPQSGWMLYNVAEGYYERFSGSAWAELAMSGGTVPTETIIIAMSDETTALTAGTAKVTLRMPYAFTLTEVRASVTTAPTGSVLTVDINEGGASVLSTKLTIDAGEKTSTTAVAAAVISDAALADDAEITLDIDTVGSTIAGAGLKVYLIGHQ